MRLFIEPIDVWLFRDGKPFSPDHLWARSLFPPTPETIQGVIRSKVLFDSGVSPGAYARGLPEAQRLIEQIGGPGSSWGRLRIRGPYLAQMSNDTPTRYYPLPADLVRVGEEEEFHILAPLSDPAFQANWPQERMLPLWSPSREIKGASGWISEEGLRDYLQGEPPSANAVLKFEAVFSKEPRVGIQMDHAVYRVKEEGGGPFQVDFIRLEEGFGLDLEMEEIEPWEPKEGVLGIGGEARAGRYKVLEKPALEIPTPTPLPLRFKLYLATPAYFAGGWCPPNWDKWFRGGEVRLIAAAMNRPLRIGGWDFVAKKDKPMWAFAPAGSVYYFEAEGEVSYTGEPVTEYGGQIGYGEVLFGKWDYVKEG